MPVLASHSSCIVCIEKAACCAAAAAAAAPGEEGSPPPMLFMAASRDAGLRGGAGGLPPDPGKEGNGVNLQTVPDISFVQL